MNNEWTDEVDVLAYAIHQVRPGSHCRYTNTDRKEAEAILSELQKHGFTISGMTPWANKIADASDMWKRGIA